MENQQEIMSVNRIFTPKAQKSKNFDLKFEWVDNLSVDTVETRRHLTSAILKWPIHIEHRETGLKIQIKYHLNAMDCQEFRLEIVPSYKNGEIKLSKLYQKLSICVKFQRTDPYSYAFLQGFLEQDISDGIFEIDLNNISSKRTKLSRIMRFYEDPHGEHRFEFKAQIRYVDILPFSIKNALLARRESRFGPFGDYFLNEYLSDVKVRIPRDFFKMDSKALEKSINFFL